MVPRHKIIGIFFVFFFLFFLRAAKAQAATLYWVGANGANASVAANWSTTNPSSCSTNVTPSGAIPGSADEMRFDPDCDNGTAIDSSFSSTVTTLTLSSGYTGTVTLSNPLTTSGSVTISGGTLTGTSQLSVGTTLTLSGGTANFGSYASYSVTGTTLATTGTLTLSSTANTLAALTINGGTVTQSAGTFSASSTVNLSSGSLTLANGADLNGALTISGGTFNAPSGTMTLAIGLTITNYPSSTIFNANSGTITFDGSTASLNCSNVPFATVTINTTGTKTVNADCSLPLGTDPTIAGSGSVTLIGALTGNGTLTKTSGTLTMSSGTPTITGFTAMSVNAMTISGATVNLSNISSITANGTFTISSGSFIGPSSSLSGVSITQSGGTVTCTSGASWSTSATFTVSGATVGTGNCNLDLNGPFILSSGSITAPGSGESMTVAGSMTFSSTGDFIPNGGTLTFDGGVATLSCNNEQFNMVTFTHTSGAKTISSNCSLPLGNNPSATNNITVNGELTGSGTLFLTRSLVLNNGSSLAGFSGLSLGNLVVDTRTLDLSNFSPAVMYGEFASNAINLTNGATLIAPTGELELYDDVHFESGTFTHNNGTVELHSSSFNTNIDIFLGSNSLYNLTTVMDRAFLVRFIAGSTNTILGNLSLKGVSATTPLQVYSSTAGQIWNIDARDGRVLQYLDVKDSNNINGTAMICSGCTDSGNNTNWDFNSEPITLELSEPGNEAYLNSGRPTFKWKAANDQASSSISGYTLEVNNGDTGSWSISDIPISRTSDYETDKYLVHYENFSDDNSDNDYISVQTKSSSSWNSSENDGSLKEGKRSWKVTATDSVGNSVSNQRTVFIDTTQPSIQLSQIGSNPFTSGTYVSPTSQPTVFGKLTDPLASGDNSTTAQSESGPQVASGPKQVEVTLEKKLGLLYTLVSTTVVTLDQTKFTCDDQVIANNTQQTCDKYSAFSFTPEKKLAGGIYRVTLKGADNASNTSETAFTLQIPGVTQKLAQSAKQKLNSVSTQKLPSLVKDQTDQLQKEMNQVSSDLQMTQNQFQQTLSTVVSRIRSTLQNLWQGVIKFRP